MSHRVTATCIALTTTCAIAAPAAIAEDDPGGGTQVGGSVPSFLSLSLVVDEAAKTIKAAVTSTDAPTTLSVANSKVFTPFSEPLIATWLSPIASASKTIPFALAGSSPATVLITVSSQTP